LDHGTAKTIKELYNYDLTAERERKWMACQVKEEMAQGKNEPDPTLVLVRKDAERKASYQQMM
jgi:hypothetical protein